MLSTLTVNNPASETCQMKAAACGNICQVMLAAASHRHVRLNYLSDVVMPAIAHGNVKIYFSDMGLPIGYAIWAFLSVEVHERLKIGADRKLHLSEWNEGSSLWVIDLLAPFGHFENIYQDLKNNVFEKYDLVNFSKYKSHGFINKQITLKRFF